MSKNPFVNCKSRKRRKARIPIAQPKEKLFCPRTMVRYDGSHDDYPTKWVCKMCLKCILNEEAVTKHLTNCSGKAAAPPPQQTKKNEDTRYICEFCNKVFSRRVTLKKHLEEHEKSSSGADSELSDDEVVDDPTIIENKNDDDKSEKGNS
ncbi:hypothetical protein QTP88_004382 [Uroleucon formosanum]